MVWKVKDAKGGKKQQKKVSFATPIATELKMPKRTQPNDSIMLIKAMEGGSESQIDTGMMLMEDNSRGTERMQQALAVTLTMMERTIATAGENLVCPHTSQHCSVVEEPATLVIIDNSAQPLSSTAAPTSSPTIEVVEQQGSQDIEVIDQLVVDQVEFPVVRHTPAPTEQNKVQGVLCNTSQEVISPPRATYNNTATQDHITNPVPVPTSTTTHQEETTVDVDPGTTSATAAQPQTVEDFLASVSLPLQQPLIPEGYLTPQVQNKSKSRSHHFDTELPSQRKSTRLAKKAEMNVGKDTLQVAQDLLIKKLGDLAGEEPAADEQEPDFDFYAQHFQRPIEKNKMEAIRVLIEEGNKKMKMGSITRKMTAQVGLDA
jgi:hypothetical protein